MRDGLLLGGLSPPYGHLQRVDDELGTDVIRDRPAHHPPTERVEDDRAVELAGVGGMFGDIHHPEAVRLGGVELAADQIIAGFGAVTFGAAVFATAVDALHAGLAHQPLDAFARAERVQPEAKFGVDSGRSVRTA